MKNAILGLALVGLALGCRSDKNTSVSDPSGASMPKAECNMKSKEGCTEAQKAECQGMKMKECCKKAEQPQN